jgi:hypothetical protein
VKRAAVASDCGKHPSVAWLGTSWSGGEQLSTRGDCVWKRAWEVSVDVPREPFGGVKFSVENTPAAEKCVEGTRERSKSHAKISGTAWPASLGCLEH